MFLSVSASDIPALFPIVVSFLDALGLSWAVVRSFALYNSNHGLSWYALLLLHTPGASPLLPMRLLLSPSLLFLPAGDFSAIAVEVAPVRLNFLAVFVYFPGMLVLGLHFHDPCFIYPQCHFWLIEIGVEFAHRTVSYSHIPI